MSTIQKQSNEFLKIKETYARNADTLLTPSQLGYETYADVANVSPIDGVGGSPNILFSINTSTPISNDADFQFIKDSNNRQGEGVSYSFDIDSIHNGRLLQGSIECQLTSGTYETGDLRFYIIDVVDGTVIEPVNVKLQLGIIGVSVKHIFSFQTHISNKSYKLCIHVASTSALAYTVDFNNFKIWEPIANYGAFITDWVSYTPTFTNMGTSPSSDLIWRRNGSNLEIKGRMTLGSAVPNSVGSITLPGVSAVNTGSFSSVQAIGLCIRANGIDHQCNVLTNPSSPNLLNFSSGDGTANALTPQNTSSIVNSGEAISFNVSVPIQGWGSNMALSSDVGDGRQVSVLVHGNINTGANVSVNFTWSSPTVAKDTHNSFDATLGFKAPYAGLYGFSGMFNTDLSTVGLATCIDGTITPYPITISNTFGYFIFSGQIYLKAGQYLTFRPTSSGVSAVGGGNNLSIYSINNSNQIIASNETVACRYTTDTAQNNTTVKFEDRDFDTHGTYNIVDGKYTIPSSGVYFIASQLIPVYGASFSFMYCKKNNNVTIAANLLESGGGYYTNTMAFTHRFIQGETVYITMSAGTSLITGSNHNYFSIHRVG